MTPTLRRVARRVVLGSALALSGALLALGSAGPAAAAPAAAILIRSCPYTVSRPGLYVLARDLTCPHPAITVTADNVRLNLGGHTLTGSEGYGVVARGTEGNPTIEGLRVENGTVRGFTRGISIYDAPGVRVAGVTATGNYSFGIFVQGSPNAWVASNTASVNGVNGTAGILVWNSSRSRVTGNTASRNDDYGIAADECDGCEITSNRTNDNGNVGLALFEISGARVAGNTSTGHRYVGIQVNEGSTGNRLEGNTATGNGVDLRDENLPACVNTWRANRFATDNEGGAAAGPGAGCIQ